MTEISIAASKNIAVAAPIHERLMAIKADRSKRLGRTVSLSEVLELLLDTWAEVAS